MNKTHTQGTKHIYFLAQISHTHIYTHTLKIQCIYNHTKGYHFILITISTFTARY